MTRDNQVLVDFVANAETVTALTWSSDGSSLVTGGNDSVFRVWDSRTGSLLRELAGLTSGISTLTWQPSGTVLLASGFDTFQAWHTVTWTPFTEQLSVSFADMAWNSQGSQVAVASINALIGIIDRDDLNKRPIEFRSLRGHSSIPYSVNWSPDGTQLVSGGGRDGSVRLWDVASGQQVAVLLQTEEVIQDAVFTENGTAVVAVTDSGTLYTIDVATGQVSGRIIANAQLWTVAWNPQYELLALGGLDTSALNTNAIQTDVATATVDPQETAFLQILSP
ncbi:MAG: hypothetical protein SF123_17550 [Chloroflexota bacterium]|nr:hypothetical protein [Chloroflexota bacterium]